MIWLGALLAGLLALLLAPWGVEVSSIGGVRRFRLIAAGLRVSFPLRPSGSIRSANPGEPHHPPAPTDRSPDHNFSEWLEVAREIEWSRLLRALRTQVRSVRIRIRRFDLIIATPDPALTGISYGLAVAGVSLAPALSAASLVADFESVRPRADFRMDVTVIPLRLTVASIRVLGALPLRRLHRLWVESKPAERSSS